MERLLRMKTGIFGAVALALGVWALVEWWWFAVEVLQGVVAIALVVGGALAVTIAIRKMLREKAAAE